MLYLEHEIVHQEQNMWLEKPAKKKKIEFSGKC